VASINIPDHRSEQLTSAEREEAAVTYYIKKNGISGAFKAHIKTLLTQQLSYLRGLFFALCLGQWDLKKSFMVFLFS
jgi:hypothetical protein